ncbi:PTS glucitol/sorbitol transporter subunit IIA [Enterococcus hulanensis]|uniref:PTS glucitol/sorbitol transporter subunit IIA n=1 Tax=Enterococcus hulanensis TaxID=2559929 RepID=UPI001A90C4C2|nr:PTS glucitol/sorbitol transporter subunit IIA [Enterococcus hulanensis]MBO0455861.1 PTS glucitol/sorbitol transporter subunit IIA [Enterococcus hulanensis]
MTRTKVISIGADAYFEDYPILVLFNEEAPDELKDICILHRFIEAPKLETFIKGAKIRFDYEEYTITKVGNVAFENFSQLGHLSFHFGAGIEDILPGSIGLDRSEVPQLHPGSVIDFIA